jgi:hypothetical protein
MGVDHLPSPPHPIFEMINYNNFVETQREDFLKESNSLKNKIQKINCIHVHN